LKEAIRYHIRAVATDRLALLHCYCLVWQWIDCTGSICWMTNGRVKIL